jgi:hypothetical protein
MTILHSTSALVVVHWHVLIENCDLQEIKCEG